MRTRTRAWTKLILSHDARSFVSRSCIVGLYWLIATIPMLAEAAPIRVLLWQNLPTFSLSVPADYTVLTQPADLLPAEANHWRTLDRKSVV